MNQRSQLLFVCLFLLSTAIGCGNTTTPQSPQSPQSPQPTTSLQVPVASWKTIKGNGVELSLPPNYEGGNPSKDLDALTQKLKAVGPEYTQGIQSLKANPNAVALLAFDPQSARSGFMTNVNITTEKVPSGTTIEQYLDAAVKQLGTQYQVVERKVVSVGSYQAGRILAESIVEGKPIKQLFYLIKNGDTFWLVTYSTAKSEFDQRLPNFEKSISTFALSS